MTGGSQGEGEMWQGILLSIRALVPVICSWGHDVTASAGKCPSLEDLWSCQWHREGLQGEEALSGSDLTVMALEGAGEWDGGMG